MSAAALLYQHVRNVRIDRETFDQFCQLAAN